MAQRQRGRCEDGGRRAGITLAGEDVEDDVGGMDAVCDRFGTSRLYRRQSVGEHRGEDLAHLPIAVVAAGELAPHALHGGRQHPILEGCAVAQGAGLAGEHRDVMPGVIERIAATERAGMLTHDPPVLTDYDAVRIGMNPTGRPTALAATEYLLLSKRTRQV